MKHVMLFITLCLLSLSAQGQTESGIIAEGGIGNIKTKLNPSAAGAGGSYDVGYRYNLSLGYKLRLHAAKASPFFYDLEAGLGVKFYDYTFGKAPGEPATVDASAKRFSAFATGTANYTLCKGKCSCRHNRLSFSIRLSSLASTSTDSNDPNRSLCRPSTLKAASTASNKVSFPSCSLP